MVWPAAIAVGAAAVVGGLLSSKAQSSAAKRAASSAERQTAMGIEFQKTQLAEQQRQYNEQMQEYKRKQQMLETQQQDQRMLLAPNIQAGQGALFEMMALSGLGAPEKIPIEYSKIRQPGVATGGMAQILSQQMPKTGGSQITSVGPGTILDPNKPKQSFSPYKSTAPMSGNQSIAPMAGNQSMNQYDPMRPELGGAVYVDGAYHGYIEPKATTASPIQSASSMNSKYGGMSPHDYYNKMSAEKDAEFNAARQSQEYMSAAQMKNPYAGMTRDEAQAASLSRIANSPIMNELMRQGETAMLQRASATGGLRGGNIQAALAQFRPRMLNEEIDKQYGRYAQLMSTGQQSILGSPTQSQQLLPSRMGMDTSIADMYSNLGATLGQAQIARGQAQGQMWSDIGKGAGMIGYGMYSQ